MDFYITLRFFFVDNDCLGKLAAKVSSDRATFGAQDEPRRKSGPETLRGRVEELAFEAPT